MFSGSSNKLVGKIFDIDEENKILETIKGTWNEEASCKSILWRGRPLPPNADEYFGFSRFAMNLNHLKVGFNPLPPTDSRFRPDQRALEYGNLDTAEHEKQRIENDQRERRKRRLENNLPSFSPNWFVKGDSSDTDYKFKENNCYWAQKSSNFKNTEFEFHF